MRYFLALIFVAVLTAAQAQQSTMGRDPASVTNVFNEFNTARLPHNANLNNLTHFWTNMNGGGPIRILTITDLAGFPGGREFIDSFTGLVGYNGTFGFSFGGNNGDDQIALSANVTTVVDVNSFPFSLALTPLTNAQTLTLSRRSAGTGITDTNIYSDTVKVSWIADTNGGSFTLQGNAAGAGWVTLLTLNSLASGTNAASTNVSTTLGYNSFRCNGVSGTNRIITIGAENSTSNNFYYGELGIQGRSFNDVFSVPTNQYYAAFTNFNPSLVMLQDMDQLRTPAYWSNVVTWITNTMPQADILVVNNHASDPAGVNEGYNYQAFTNALLYSLGHWDAYYYLGTNTVALTNAFMLNYNDTAHLSANGTAYLNNRLWGDLIAPFLGTYVNGGNQNIKYQGSTANLFNNARTNKLGIGVAAPDSRLEVVNPDGSAFRVNGSGGTVYLHVVNQATPWTLANYFVAGDAAGDVLLNCAQSSGNFFFLINNSTKGELFASGGFAIGANPGQDPGANNLGVTGIIYATNCFNGSGNQITNTGLTVSTNSTAPGTPGTIAAWMNVTNQQGKIGKIPVYY